MRITKQKVLFLLTGFAALVAAWFALAQPEAPVAYVSYRVDLRREQLRLYWKDAQNQRIGSLLRLEKVTAAQGDTLVFAMNAGMFTASHAPQGLFIQADKTIVLADTSAGDGNFYLKPNGIFYLTTANEARICPTTDFRASSQVRYATQSGPMLVIDGNIHPAFRPGSSNKYVRNGVGILPDKRVLLAMSKTPVSLYDFADYFRRAGCRNALYLDGYVSRTYAPAAGWVQTDGDFGVIIGVTTPKQ
ncbi:phosphodiester glycosidase family protein [Hymenobacter negativus]|uniref:Phosphodiester glycosidase family protein n=1 Tax=Hymenobacter negativus TaxID=2795026 RepID=A0ABS3QAD8_9BACT|nr:phosphodiester glycosidase family protein [Hymenobacter negativus]MBO2008161.1 phosphodiester glycosidase family protein [Hymenobacter negativus]